MLVKLVFGFLAFSGCLGFLPFANNSYILLAILVLLFFAFFQHNNEDDMFTPYIVGIFVSLILCSISSNYFRGQSGV